MKRAWQQMSILVAASLACSTHAHEAVQINGRLIWNDLPYLPDTHACVVWDVTLVDSDHQIRWHSPERPCTGLEELKNRAMFKDECHGVIERALDLCGPGFTP